MATLIDKVYSLNIGVQGENIARAIELDMTEWVAAYPDASFHVLFKPYNESEAVPMVSTFEDNILTWTPTLSATAVSGVGYTEIRALDPETGLIRKSRIIPTSVENSVTGADENPPQPYVDWVNRILEAGSDAVKGAAAVAAVSQGEEVAFEIDVDGHLNIVYTESGEPQTIDLGPVDAYAIAVVEGYTGTREEWVQAMADAEANGLKAEGYAIGKQNGVAVESGEYYQNNAKYYNEQAQSAKEDAEAAQTAAETAQTAAETAQTSAEASAAEAAQYTSTAVHTWLENNIDPATGYALDRTLKEPLEAAPADMVGDLKSAIEYNLSELNCYNLFDNISRTNRTHSGIDWVWNGEYLNASGQATATENYSVFSSLTELPDGMEAGKTYRVLHTTSKITTKIYDYVDSSTSVELFNSKNPGEFTIPSTSTGMIIRFTVSNSTSLNETFAPVIVSADVKTNKELAQHGSNLETKIKNNYFDEKYSLMALLAGHTINLMDSTAITSGYILVDNVPTTLSGYFYSDYMDISGLPFCYRNQGTSISNLVSCYDENKVFIGAIDFAKNSEYYKQISDYTPKPTSYYEIVPLPGTKYVRVNGRYTTNLMLTPLFYPDEFVEYNHIYYRFSTGNPTGLKIAMFGDSITYGTDGDDHSAPYTKNLPYWVERIDGFFADNYGVGSMGWVSTQYLDQIAYDKISTTDISAYDVITMCFGVNDTGAVLGTYESTDETTIMGQINKCVKYIGAQNPKARIIIVAPWNGASSGASFPLWGYGRKVYFAESGDATRTKTRKDLSEEEKKLCEVYGLGFIGQDDSPLNGFGLGTASGTTPGPYIGADLVHPSKDGYKAMGEWLSAKIKGIIA